MAGTIRPVRCLWQTYHITQQVFDVAVWSRDVTYQFDFLVLINVKRQTVPVRAVKAYREAGAHPREVGGCRAAAPLKPPPKIEI